MYFLVYNSLLFSFISYFLFIIHYKLKDKVIRSSIIIFIVSLILTLLAYTVRLTFEVTEIIAYAYTFFCLMLLIDCRLKELLIYILHISIGYSIFEEIVGNFLEIIFHINDPVNNIVTLIFIGFFCVLLGLLTSKKIPIYSFWLPEKLKYIFLTIELMLSLMSTLGLYAIIRFKFETKITNTVASIGSFALLVLLYWFIYYINVIKDQANKMQGLTSYNQQQKYYYELLLSKEEQTRKFRHDIQNDLLQMKYYLNNNDIDKTNNKVEQLLNNVDLIKKKNYSIGIELIDVILNYYLIPVSDDIKIVINSSVSNNMLLSVDDSDICVMVANLIKNAIEATSVLDKEQRKIILTIKAGKQNFYIKVSNTFDPGRNSMISEGTSKADKKNHGFGVKKIQEITDRYNGTYKQQIEDNLYTTEIYITI